MPHKIRLDTFTEAQEFAAIASTVNGSVIITDGKGLRVNGKSVLGVLHALEFTELYCETDGELNYRLQKFVVNE